MGGWLQFAMRPDALMGRTDMGICFSSGEDGRSRFSECLPRHSTRVLALTLVGDVM